MPLPETPNQPLSEGDIYDLLKDDSSAKPEEKAEEEVVEEDTKEDDEKENEKEEEEDEEKEIELVDEEDEPKEDEDELEFDGPISRKAVLAKYPNLFKEFPALEKGYYREQKYAEVFPTLDDAREAKERVEVLQNFEQHLFSGNNELILNEVKTKDPKAFAKIVDNYLPNLYKVDQNAYMHVVGEGVIKPVVIKMLNEAKNSNDEKLQEIAAGLYKYIFPGSQFQTPQKFSKEFDDTSEVNKLNEDRQKFQQEQFNTVRNELAERVENVLTSTIANNIDPKGQMSSYVKKNAVRDCVIEVNKLIVADKRFIAAMDNLWRSAAKSNYSTATRQQIKQAYLSKAKALLPAMIQKIRKEAVTGSRPAAREDEKTTKRLPVGKSVTSSSKAKKTEYKGGRSADFFLSD